MDLPYISLVLEELQKSHKMILQKSIKLLIDNIYSYIRKKEFLGITGSINEELPKMASPQTVFENKQFATNLQFRLYILFIYYSRHLTIIRITFWNGDQVQCQ